MLKLIKCFSFVLALGVSSQAFSATVYLCSKSQKRCIVRIDDGRVGDKVRILDESAYMVGKGKIIKRQDPKNKKSRYAVIQLEKKYKDIRKGYPVVVEVEHKDSSGMWAPHFPRKK